MAEEIGSWKGMLKELKLAIKIRLSHRKTVKRIAKLEKAVNIDNLDTPLSSVPVKKVKAPRLVWLNPKLVAGIIEGIVVLGLCAGFCALVLGIIGFLLFIFAGMCIDCFMFFWNMNVWLRIRSCASRPRGNPDSSRNR